MYWYFACLGRRILDVQRRTLVIEEWRILFGIIGLAYHPGLVAVGEENIGELSKQFGEESLKNGSTRSLSLSLGSRVL